MIVSQRASLTVAVALALCVANCAGSLVNEDVERNVDIRSNVEIVTTTLKLRNDGSDAVRTFIYALNADVPNDSVDLFVSLGKSVSKNFEKRLQVRTISATSYEVHLKEAVQPAHSVTVTLMHDVHGTLRASPSEIRAREDQYMRYTGHVHYYSVYPTEKERTVIALPAARPVSHSQFPEPHTLRKYQVVLGPYNSVPARTSLPLWLRVSNNRGFLVAENAKLSYHVSHWGRIAVREEYKIRNDAARLTGEWSRADYDRNRGLVDPTSHGDVWANLPSDAERVVYEDLIGNITTSRLRQATNEHRALMLVFRYPLLGGWRTHFWYRYEIALGRHITTQNSRHQLTLPALPSLHYDLPIEHHQVIISLPFGASDIQVDSHATIPFDVSYETQWSTLSVRKRPTVVLNRTRVRSQAPHAHNITIRYTFGKPALLIAPAAVVTALLGIFGVALLIRIGRSSVALGRDVAGDAAADARKGDIAALNVAFENIAAQYKVLQTLHNRVRTAQVADLAHERDEVMGELGRRESALQEILDKTANLSLKDRQRVLAILPMLKKKRELSMRILAIENSDMGPDQYHTEMFRIAPKVTKLSQSIADDIAAFSRGS